MLRGLCCGHEMDRDSGAVKGFHENSDIATDRNQIAIFDLPQLVVVRFSISARVARRRTSAFPPLLRRSEGYEIGPVAAELAGEIEFEENKVDLGGGKSGVANDIVDLDRRRAERFDDKSAAAFAERRRCRRH